MQRTEFHEALLRMEQQAVALRRNALQAKMREGALDGAEKDELRELLAARVPPAAAS
jgi:DNA primase